LLVSLFVTLGGNFGMKRRPTLLWGNSHPSHYRNSAHRITTFTLRLTEETYSIKLLNLPKDISRYEFLDFLGTLAEIKRVKWRL